MDITSKAMLVSLTIKTWSGSKIDKRVSQDVADQHGADRDAGNYSKKLVAKDALAEIKSISGEARSLNYQYTLPWSQDGARILPSAMHAKYSSEMREIQDRFEREVKSFLADYAYQIGIARNRLGTKFNEAASPSPQEIEGKFG